MSDRPLYPSLYQLNTHVQPEMANLDRVPEAFLDQLATLGFDWLWPLGIWENGTAGRDLALAVDDWGRAAYQQLLPDLTDADICTSPFAVQAYTVPAKRGGDAALARLRERLHLRGQRLLLDFVPNHTALDHPWTQTHPEFYVHGTAADLQAQPQNYRQFGALILAHGRDPYFPRLE